MQGLGYELTKKNEYLYRLKNNLPCAMHGFFNTKNQWEKLYFKPKDNSQEQEGEQNSSKNPQNEGAELSVPDTQKEKGCGKTGKFCIYEGVLSKIERDNSEKAIKYEYDDKKAK